MFKMSPPSPATPELYKTAISCSMLDDILQGNTHFIVQSYFFLKFCTNYVDLYFQNSKFQIGICKRHSINFIQTYMNESVVAMTTHIFGLVYVLVRKSRMPSHITRSLNCESRAGGFSVRFTNSRINLSICAASDVWLNVTSLLMFQIEAIYSGR